MDNAQYQTPTTTADSIRDGRMKVDVGGKKKKILKKVIRKKKYNMK